MPLDTLTTVTDDVTDILAAHHNELVTAMNKVMASVAYANYSTVASMTGNVTLTDASMPILSYSPTAARDLTLPAVATTNHPFFVFNRSSTYSITVKNASAVVIFVIAPLSHVSIVSEGSNGWYVTTPGYRETFYKIVPSVTSNNLTVAIKHLDGTDPTSSRPLWFKIGDTWRALTAALSVTKNAATNWGNAGSAEMATKEIDWFQYIGYNATDGIVTGFSRIPYARLYSNFSATSTNEKYCAISTITNAAAGDDYVNIGRFAATLSAGAGYTWSVPTFTSTNLKHLPTLSTRPRLWAASRVAGAGNISTSSGSITTASFSGQYEILEDVVYIQGALTVTTNNTGTGDVRINLPFACASTPSGYGFTVPSQRANDNKMCIGIINQTSTYIQLVLYDGSYPAVDGTIIVITGKYFLQ